jgi:hypothetical protein
MQRLFILLALIGVTQIISGFNTSATLVNPLTEIDEDTESNVLTPRFTELDGNLFIAVKTDDNIEVEDGDVVEFVFNKKTKLISFHINDINQNLIDTGEANLFVMVHQDLALKLRSHRLKQINVIHNGKKQTIKINKFWLPDAHLGSL